MKPTGINTNDLVRRIRDAQYEQIKDKSPEELVRRSLRAALTCRISTRWNSSSGRRTKRSNRRSSQNSMWKISSVIIRCYRMAGGLNCCLL